MLTDLKLKRSDIYDADLGGADRYFSWNDHIWIPIDGRVHGGRALTSFMHSRYCPCSDPFKDPSYRVHYMEDPAPELVTVTDLWLRSDFRAVELQAFLKAML